MEKYEVAAAIFNDVTQSTTSDINIWDCFAQLYAKQGDFAEARKIIRKAIHFNADSALLPYRLAAYYLLDDEKQKGLAILEKALSAHPDESDYFFDVFEEGSVDQDIMDLVNQYRKNHEY
jgi:predicted Zn-dependent protease